MNYLTQALREHQELAVFLTLAIGYTVPYAIGNTVLTAWKPVLVAMMT
jgi:putative transport protein